MNQFGAIEPFKNRKRFKNLKHLKPLKILNREEMKTHRWKVLENFQLKDIDQANRSIYKEITYIKKEQDNLAECIDVEFTEIPQESDEN